MMQGKRIAVVLLALCLLLQLFPSVMAAEASGAEVRTITVELTGDASSSGAQAFSVQSGSFSGVYGDQLEGLARELYDAYRAYYVSQGGAGALEHALASPVSFRSMSAADGSPTDDAAYNAVADQIFYAHQIALCALLFDHPELFWIGVDNGDGTITLGSTDLAMEVTMNGENAPADYTVTGIRYTPMEVEPGASAKRQAFEDGTAAAVAQVRQNAGSDEPFRLLKAAHDYLCRTLTYDRSGGAYIYNAGSVFLSDVAKKAVCEGYAEAFKVLCDRLGIPCALVCGTAANPSGGQENHKWNAVMLDGAWYLVDVTWDDQTDAIRSTYFLAGLEAWGFFDTIDAERTADPHFALDTFAFALPEISSETHPDAAAAAQGELVEAGDFTVALRDGKASIVKYHGSDAQVTTPTEVRGCPVTFIERLAFSENPTLEELTISEGVTMMGNEAIFQCSALKTLRLPSTFDPESGESSGLESGLSWVPSWCDSLERVVIAENNPYLTVSADGALYDKAMTTLIYWPENNPNELLAIPEGVTSIESSACEHAKHLREVRMPDTVTFIGYWAFSGAVNLEKINISEACEVIGQFAFVSTAITSIRFPASVRDAAQDALRSSRRLKRIEVDENNPTYASADGVWFDKDMQKLILYPCGREAASYQIPEGVTTISDNAITADSLTEVFVPASVTGIGARNFDSSITLHGYSGSACEAYAQSNGIPFVSEGQLEIKTVQSGEYEGVAWELKSDGTMVILGPDRVPGNIFNGGIDFAVRDAMQRIVVAEGITEIESWGFSCARAESIQLPVSLVSIGDQAFNDAFDAPATLAIPKNVTSIGFMGVANRHILRYEVDPENRSFRSVDGVLFNRSGTELIAYPPAGSEKPSYTVPDGVVKIGAEAFLHAGTRHVILPDSVKSLGVFCFFRCNIGYLHLGSGVTELPEKVFMESSFGSVFFAGKVKKAAPDAFMYCRAEKIYTAYSEQDWNAIGLSASDKAQLLDADFQYGFDCASPHYDLTGSVPPREGAEGLNFYSCPVCGFEDTEPVPPLDHSHTLTAAARVPATCTHSGREAYWSCDTCGKLFADAQGEQEISAPLVIWADGHEWDSGRVTQQPTETSAGVRTFTCTVCGETRTEAIPGLTHSLTAVAKVPVTCTEDGTEAYWKCADCGKLFSDAQGKHEISAPVEIRASGHRWDFGEVTQPPTETAEGVKTFTCTLCGEKRTHPIPRLTPSTFTDVVQQQYYAAPVQWAVEQGITNGTGASTFSPDETCRRGQIVTFIWRAKGCPEPLLPNNPFVDVMPDDYYYKAVLWAVEQGITNGTSPNTFSPDQGCTRGQVVTFLWRAEGKPAQSGAKNAFTDVRSGEYYYDAVLWAVAQGITNGTSPTTFSPGATCTRGQIVTFLYRDVQ